MRENIITGIDVGSRNVRVIVAEYSHGAGTFTIRALVKTESDGLKNGYIINQEAVSQSILSAIREAERSASTRIKTALLGIGGIGLGITSDISTVAVSRADSIVSEFDLDRLSAESEARILERPNTRILHSIPAECKLDGRKLMGKPFGYNGNKLELRTMYITCANPHVEALVKAVEAAGVEVSQVYANPIAESLVTLSTTARNAGVALANIGSETVTLLTWENGQPTSLKVFPLGSTDITHDVALGLRISIEDAEKIKLDFNETEDKKVAKRISEIIEARVSDIFELIDTHLKKIGRSGLLPAGIIFTGEGAHIPMLDVWARKQLALPARIGKSTLPADLSMSTSDNSREQNRTREKNDRAKDPEWSVILGLAVLGTSEEPEESLGLRVAKRTKSGIVNFLRQFLP